MMRMRAQKSDSLTGRIVFRLVRYAHEDKAAARKRAVGRADYVPRLVLDHRSMRYWVFREPCATLDSPGGEW